MPQFNVRMDVRKISPTIGVIDIQGEISAAAEQTLTEAYNQLSPAPTRVVILNFSGLSYMNSSGIGLLVTLLVRVKRQKQSLLAYGLSEHYRHIFEITRLSDAILLYDSEQDAVAAAQTI